MALVATLANQEVRLHHIEISDDDALVEQYGTRIRQKAIDERRSSTGRGLDENRDVLFFQLLPQTASDVVQAPTARKQRHCATA